MITIPKELDALVFLKTEKNTDKNIQYITQIETDLGLLILSKRKKPILFLSSLEEKPKRNDIIIQDFSFEIIQKELQKLSSKKIGISYSETTLRNYNFLKQHIKQAKWFDISKTIEASKQKKQPFEIQHIKKAVAITESIFQELFSLLPTLTYELEAVQFLRRACLEHNVTPSFDPIVASGKNASNPHYVAKKNTRLQSGFCVIDFGVFVDGYASDMTRTVYLGTPTKEEISFYETIHKELKTIEKEVTISNYKFDTSFKMIHALGHGIGLEVHEAPYVGREPIKEHTCIAIEPALYEARRGVRIENNYIMKKKGLKRLGTLTDTLQIIPLSKKKSTKNNNNNNNNKNKNNKNKKY